MSESSENEDRFTGEFRATRQQVQKEWELHFRDLLAEGIRISRSTTDPTAMQLMLSELAKKEAKEIVILFAQTVKGLTGKELP